MKTFLKNLPLRIDLWIRANITQRAHWLRVFDERTYYCDIDDVLKAVVYQLAKRYLYDELGHKDQAKPDKLKLYGEVDFYKGFRIDVVGEEKRIDICLDYINVYENREKININNFTDYNMFNDERFKAENCLSDALIKFVNNRGSLWT